MMNLRNQKIGVQLWIGFTVILIFVATLGYITYRQTSELHTLTQTMYNHPMQVRRATAVINYSVQQIRVSARDLVLARNEDEKHDALHLIEDNTQEIHRRFDIIYERYLGPEKDIDEAYRAFSAWISKVDQDIKSAVTGEKLYSLETILIKTEVIRKLREDMFVKVSIIDSYARNKSDTLYARSEALKKDMTIELAILTIFILTLTLIVYFWLLRSIRRPLSILTEAAQHFDHGNMSVRSSYNSRNEFGVLSNSFNILAENIQTGTELNKKSATFADKMLLESKPEKFFLTTLNILMDYTSSQMAAAYLLSEDRKSFEHFISIGLDEDARKRFSAIELDGEIGLALSAKNIRYTRDIPQDAKLVLSMIGGKLLPKEIVTIPILSGDEVIAVISLASVNEYNQTTRDFIDKIYLTYCAGIDGILSNLKIRRYSEKLSSQNQELEAQKTELSSQSVELTEQNRELEMQKQQLSEASKLKTIFLSNMSHELRTPLNSVIALSGVLNRRLSGQIPEEEYSYLEVIERNGKNLLSLINDILDIARIESGREEVEISEFNICDSINEIIEMLRPQAMAKNLRIKRAFGDCETMLISDAHKIKHIFQNLISNALKFTDEGEIDVSVTKRKDYLHIVVSDTGIGISEEHLPHIFEEFRQADGSTSRKYGGTGLGLAIVKKYANLLGGDIHVKSIYGTGSEFTLTLPLEYHIDKRINDEQDGRLPAPPPRQGSKTVNPLEHRDSKTILLIEDSEPAIIQVMDFLEESGYNVLVARDGSQGLQRLAETVPDAIILDLMMPDIDGFEVLKNIRQDERNKAIPVLILTAKHVNKQELNFLKENHIYQLILKGDIKRDDLLRIVNEMVSLEETEPTPEPEKPQDIIVQPEPEQNKAKGVILKPRILVVEDNPDNMIAVRALLSDNYIIIGAADGLEGVRMAKIHQPDLILMDISLPGMDGIEAFKQIKKESYLHHIPIIALTASALIQDRETILAHGFEAFVAKPIDEKVFFKTINEILYGK